MTSKRLDIFDASPIEIIELCAGALGDSGRKDLAAQIMVIGRTADRQWISVVDAAELADVSQQTIKNWIGRGVLVSRQAAKGSRHQVDRSSLTHAIDRRADVDRARAAFSDRASAIEHISGLDAATIERLGGV